MWVRYAVGDSGHGRWSPRSPSESAVACDGFGPRSAVEVMRQPSFHEGQQPLPQLPGTLSNPGEEWEHPVESPQGRRCVFMEKGA